VLWDFALESECQGDRGGQHPEKGVHYRGDAETPRITQLLIKAMLNKSADRSANERAGYIESSHNAVQPGVAAAKTVGKLHGTEQERACRCQAMRQEPPLERLVVHPGGIARVDQEPFVVVEDVGHHQEDEAEHDILRAQRRRCLQWRGTCR